MNTHQFQSQQKNMPKTRITSVAPRYSSQQFIIKFTQAYTGQSQFRDVAKILNEHIDIVEESRKLIQKKKVTSWTDFQKTHEEKRGK